MCRGSEVVVVGGGNSAGQAAVFLAGQVRKVYLVIRGDDLYKNMSSYLARRIEQTPNIEVLRNTEVRRMPGDGHLGAVELVNNKTGEARTLEDPGAVQLHRRGAADRLAAPGDRDGRQGLRPDRAGAWPQSPHWTAAAAAVPAGDQPPRRVRRGGRAVRLGQARRLGRRRGGDGGPVRARVPERTLIQIGPADDAGMSRTSEEAHDGDGDARTGPADGTAPYDGFDKVLVDGTWRAGGGTGSWRTTIPTPMTYWSASPQPASGIWMRSTTPPTRRKPPGPPGCPRSGPRSCDARLPSWKTSTRGDRRLARPRVRQHPDQGGSRCGGTRRAARVAPVSVLSLRGPRDWRM